MGTILGESRCWIAYSTNKFVAHPQATRHHQLISSRISCYILLLSGPLQSFCGLASPAAACLGLSALVLWVFLIEGEANNNGEDFKGHHRNSNGWR